MNFKTQLERIEACQEAIDWVENKTFKEAWQTCERGDWMLWFAQANKLCGIRILTLAKARCAKLVIHLMKDERSKNAVYVAEQYGIGKATRKQLDDASDAASDAARAASYAASNAARAASYAASYAASDAASDAARAASAAAWDAWAASDDAWDAWAAWATAWDRTLKQCADICRTTIIIQ